MPITLTEQLETLTEQIAHLAPDIDALETWPEMALQALSSAGGWAWVVPEEYQGNPLSDVDRLRAYEALARGSVALALIMTQRDGAVMHVAAGGNTELKQQLLPEYATNRRFTSVGISQLTTSHGAGGDPHMRATPTDDGGYVLDGVMPWVTGAAYCHDLVTGGEMIDGRQILAHVSMDHPGLHVEESMKLLALTSTCTARVTCNQVHIPPEHVLVQPTEAAVRPNAPVKPLIVASVGIGLAGAIISELEKLRLRSSETLRKSLDKLIAAYTNTREQMYNEALRVVEEDDYVIPKSEVRIEVNVLLARLSVALMTAAKGTGFLRGQAAERLSREALFFNVWSAPDDVRSGTVAAFIETH